MARLRSRACVAVECPILRLDLHDLHLPIFPTLDCPKGVAGRGQEVGAGTRRLAKRPGDVVARWQDHSVLAERGQTQILFLGSETLPVR